MYGLYTLFVTFFLICLSIQYFCLSLLHLLLINLKSYDYDATRTEDGRPDGGMSGLCHLHSGLYIDTLLTINQGQAWE